jgi:hypothetical protein
VAQAASVVHVWVVVVVAKEVREELADIVVQVVQALVQVVSVRDAQMIPIIRENSIVTLEVKKRNYTLS